MPTTKKVCACCQIQKPVGMFYTNSRTKDGRDYYCKECRNSNTRAYQKTELGRAKNSLLTNQSYHRRLGMGVRSKYPESLELARKRINSDASRP